MNQTTLLRRASGTALLAAAVPALISFAPKADTIKFAPEAGTTVTKSFTSLSEFALDDMSILLDGEPNPMMPEINMEMSVTQDITVTDTYVGVADGKPTKLARVFDAAATEIEVNTEVDMMGETDNQDASGSGTSQLEGTTVHFTWDDEAGEYTASFPEGEEGDADLLENLSEDMDLRGLLPESGELSEGDSYDIDLTAMIDVFAPGGDLKLDIEMDGQAASGGPDPSMMADFRRIFEEMVEGEASGKYVGTKDVDGVTVGVIELTFDIQAARDMSDLAGEMMGEEIPEGMEMSVDRLDIEFIYEGKGELLWNMAGGHAQGLKLEGDAEVMMDMEMAMDMAGQSMTIAMEMAMSGTIENGFSVE